MNIEDQMLERLEQVLDPEVGVNIVDLGLVYDVKVDEAGKATVEMTLTIPECPLADQIVEDVKTAAKETPGVKDVDVRLVWEPKWTPAKMNDKAREEIRARHAMAP
ncbi:metal-sulfur cluster assembly factor [Paenibacillus sp. GYB003]|uniref:metal-sulfur cluster assembly factor n=1 Tax=Paenibacillus sp. GYB003 TaxID=2994392 RepID=UPI002F967E8C